MAKVRKYHIDKRMEELRQSKIKRNKRILFLAIELCIIGGLIFATYNMFISNEFYIEMKSQVEIGEET